MAQQDWTYLAIRRQLQGMACPAYEVGLRNTETGNMIPRFWEQDTLLQRQTVSWLKAMNMGHLHGRSQENVATHDIYIRPQGSQGLILMDDIGLGTMRRLEQDGLHPSAQVETSPQNYQVWIRLSDEPIPEAIATHAAKILAKRYDADPNSADWRHYGRLAGFTNRKPIYVQEYGKAPFVKAHDCLRVLAENGTEVLKEAQIALEIAQAEQEKAIALLRENYHTANAPDDLPEPVRYYRGMVRRLQNEYADRFDESRLDWMIAKDMISRGYTVDVIQGTLLEISPNIETRKLGHVEDYIQRTVQKVLTSLERE